MNKTLLALFIIQMAALPLSAQNTIDSLEGFVAVLPDGTTAAGNNDPSEYHLWQYADVYQTKGGKGFLRIAINTNTTINLTKSISVNDITISGSRSNLVINSSDTVTVRSSQTSLPALAINGGNLVTINEGIYDGYTTTGSQNSRGATIAAGVNKLVLNGTTFQGADVIVSWSRGNAAAGASIKAAETLINFEADANKNGFFGGSAYQINTITVEGIGSAGSFSKRGGDGLISGGIINATNLYAVAGDSGALKIKGVRLVNSSVTVTVDGADGISGSSTLNIHNGTSQGADGGKVTMSVQTGDDWRAIFAANGGNGLNSGTITGGTLEGVKFTGGNGGEITINSTTKSSVNLSMNGGHGFTGKSEGGLLSGVFTGGNGSAPKEFTAGSIVANMNGGTGAINIDAAAQAKGDFIGGFGGGIKFRATDTNTASDITLRGGDGFNGAIEALSGNFVGGDGGTLDFSGHDITADVSGGTALNSSGDSIIHEGSFIGGNGGSGGLTQGSSESQGGDGVHQEGGTLTIHGGSFYGGDGGRANGNAQGGNGLLLNDTEATILGGKFYGGEKGINNNQASPRGYGITALNSSLTLNGADVKVEGNLIFKNDSTSTKQLNLFAGKISGSIELAGTGLTAMSLSNGMGSVEAVNVYGGKVDVTLASNDSAFFKKVNLEDGSMNFLDNVNLQGANFALNGTNSTLAFSDGGTLSATHIHTGENAVHINNGDLTIEDGSSINLAIKTTFDTNGVSHFSGGSIDATGGNLILSGNDHKLFATGIAAKYDTTIMLLTGNFDTGSNATSANAISDVVSADFGWLIDVALADNGGIEATLSYSGMDSELGDINSNVLASIETIFTDTNLTSEADFYAMNKAGASSTRFAISQMGDSADSAFQINQKVNQQISARGAEFRSMNGFASSKPSMGSQPAGAAGPNGGKEKTMQGWIRAYGSKGSADSTGTFSSYDSDTWGTIIGVDKSFGNILIGLAGGYASTDIEGSYDAEIDTYHGSLYSTYGGERVFVDVALTYGQAKTEEKTIGSDSSSYDGDLMSFYVGAGMSFDVKEKISITPKISLLSSYYDQEGFDRSGAWGSATAQSYDTTSLLSSIGVNLSTIHQMDWANRRIAFIPELRLHWIHELNADQDDFHYNVNGIGFLPFAVRSRDEDIGNIGLGFDMWSWRAQSLKLELDYDGLFSDTYTEQIVSGKITVQF